MTRKRSAKTLLVHLFDASQTPIYFFNGRGEFTYGNRAFWSWCELGSDSLLGLASRFGPADVDEPAQHWLSYLCPPPEAFSGNVVQGKVGPPNESRATLFVPIDDDGQTSRGVMALVDLPMGERVELTQATSDEATRLHQQVRDYRGAMAKHFHLNHLVGNSDVMRYIRAQIDAASAQRSSVLIRGDQGTGRRHVGRTVHFAASEGQPSRLIPLDCSILDSVLLKNTLTDLISDSSESNDPKSLTLLLMEVDRLDTTAQTVLVEFLDTERLNLRVISTSRASLIDLVQRQVFRRDLAYRLSTMMIDLPRLSARREDIPLLAQFFLEQVNADGDKQVGGFSDECMDRLVVHAWPGNVSQLVDVVRLCHESATQSVIAEGDLPSRFAHAEDAIAHPTRVSEDVQLDDLLREVEVAALRSMLQRCKGNKAQAARRLGISRPRLLRRLEQLELGEDG